MPITERHGIRVIIILSDGIRGHLNQSRGVAVWLSKLTGAEILETEVPCLSGFAKMRTRAGARRLVGGSRRDARDWIAMADGDIIVRKVGQWFAERDIHEGSREVLIISAGSTPALYNLALGYIWRCSCATIMTPGIVGTDPFDFAIVPEHDHPPRKPNVLVTLGSPNSVIKEDLQKEADKLLAEYPPASDMIWSILIGGDDANYAVTPAWMKRQIGHIMGIAEQEGADLYITTSRRTSPEAVKMLKLLASRSSSVRYLLIASEDQFNPIPAMLGFSTEVFCTEDSVNMVSETITGGHRAVLLRVEHNKGIKRLLQNATASLVNAGAVPPNLLWGIPRFDVVFDHFARHDALVEFRDWIRRRHETSMPEESDDGVMWKEFNEAKRAAQWICDNWQ
ncbi:MAG: mitochondrial fission ELM1 family protein [Synergistaceae bacterium]|nr:mitochondrial fission ELM1 family protein [Synergistaceae bacterium]